MASLYNAEIEKFVLAGLLLYPDTWGDVNMVLKDTDFAKTNRPIFSVLKQQLDKSPPESIAPIVIAERLKSYSVVSLDGGVSVLDYLDALRILPIDKKEVTNLVKQLKQTTVKRDLVNICESVKNELIHGKDKSFSEMTSLVESSISGITTSYFKEETTLLFNGLVEEMEEKRNNIQPLDKSLLLYPFQSWNSVLSGISPSEFMVTGARTGVGKSSLGFFINLYLCERYNLPWLQIDKGELTVRSLRARAISCMSEGKIPLWAAYSGEFHLNKEWLKIWREDISHRIKKIENNIYFICTSGMSPKEIVSFIRRFYYNKIGRERHLLIHDDYLKGVESLGKNSQEYQSIGYYVDDLKSLVTDDIKASVITSVQNNRSGIINKNFGKSKDIADNESSFSLSDRIIQTSTTGWVMRWKTMEEVAAEKNLFGNIKMTLVKQREFLGKDYEKRMKPIKMPNGMYMENYFSLESNRFFYRDKGDLHSMMEVLGNTIDTVSSGDKITKEDLL